MKHFVLIVSLALSGCSYDPSLECQERDLATGYCIRGNYKCSNSDWLIYGKTGPYCVWAKK